MSKPKKKVVVTTTTEDKQKTNKPTPTASRGSRTRQTSSTPVELLFKRQNYIWMAVGALLVVIGLVLMSGGHMPSPDVWEPERIYSARRTVLAPIVILAGLIIEIYAIFKK